jgi:hypothetical protein
MCLLKVECKEVCAFHRYGSCQVNAVEGPQLGPSGDIGCQLNEASRHGNQMNLVQIMFKHRSGKGRFNGIGYPA